jgi:hypothetical protein
MILYDPSYFWWLVYAAVPFIIILIITNSMTDRDVKFRDIGPEHGDGPYRMKVFTYVSAVPMFAVLVLMVGSGYYHALTSL